MIQRGIRNTARRRTVYWQVLAFLVAPILLSGADQSDIPASAARLRFRLMDLSWDNRFNYMDRQGGPVTDRGLQYRLLGRARLDLGRDGGTYFLVLAETGKGFDNSWNNTGIGLGAGQLVFDLKAISVHRRFGKILDIGVGGLDFEEGAGTDTTYASGDGHLRGYRALLQSPGSGRERVVLTAGYVGDFERANFFTLSRMNRINYTQLLVERHIGDGLLTSAEVDSLRHVVYGRGAALYRHLWVFDDARLEAVARTTNRFRFGWSASVSKEWGRGPAWRTELIYADVPYELYRSGGERILFNRGEIDVGKRLAAGVAYRLSKDCEAGIFGGRLLDSTPSKRWIAQVGMHYQFAGLLNALWH